jgi:hypothetical protein
MKRVRPYSVLLFVVVLSTLALPESRMDAQIAVAAPSIGLLRNNALNGAVLIGDFNGDGRADAVGNDPWSSPAPVVITALGQGNGRFGAPIRTTWRGGVLATGHFNTDTFLDLVIMAASPSAGLRLLPGRGDGSFGTAIAFLGSTTSFFAPFALATDFNGDGETDLAVGHADEFENDGVEVFPGRGDGTFGASVTLSTGNNSQPHGATAADFNDDGTLDIVTANHWSHSLSVFLNQGSLTFNAYDIPLDRQANAVVAADINGDRHLDLVAAMSSDAGDDFFYTAGYAYILRGNGSGTFAQPVKHETAPGAWEVVAADLNRDGKLDVATANRSAIVDEDVCGSLWDTVTILPGRSDFTFGPASTFSLGDQRVANDGRFHNSVQSLRAADINGDLRFDLVTSWGAVLLNNAPDPNWGPSVTASSTQPAPETHEIRLMASANDSDQDMLTFTWTDSGGQSIAPTSSPCFRPDTLGVHTFTVTVDDRHGHTASSSVTVDFGGTPAPYTPPSATIASPASAEIVTAGQPYTLRWSVAPGSHPITQINVRSWIDTSPATAIAECTGLSASATACVWNSPGPISETVHISVDLTDSTGRTNSVSSSRFIIRGSSGGGGTLAYGWTASDVGSVAAAGSTTHTGFVYNGEGLVLSGSGADIWGTADEFHYAWRQMTGNFEVITRITSIENVNAWTKAGLMVRTGATDPVSPHVSIFATPAKGVAFQRRTIRGGTSLSTAGPALTAPLWLRMIRMGTVIKAFYRKNPTDTWTLLGQQAVAGWPATVNVGLAVTSHADGTVADGTFMGVWTAPLPELTGRAIGAATGSVSWDGTTYTVKGSGADIWGTNDAFFFVEMPIGDYRSITARVRVLGNVDPWTKAGVMIRETLSPDSRHADAIVTPSKGIAMQDRATPGGTSASTDQRAGAAPMLLRIRRSESASGGPALFNANYSTDGGLTWRGFCCAASMPMNHLARIGIAVTSHKAGVETTALIDDVRIEQ